MPWGRLQQRRGDFALPHVPEAGSQGQLLLLARLLQEELGWFVCFLMFAPIFLAPCGLLS